MELFLNVWKKLRIHVLLLFLTLIFGTIGFKVIYPTVSWSKLFYMTSITLSTVGYGDILDISENPIAIYYTMILMLVGMGIVLYSISVITAYFIEGKIGIQLSLRKLKKRLSMTKDHYIICGAGKTGIHVINEMKSTEHQYVVIEHDQDIIDHLKEIHPEIKIVKGDATSDETLDFVNVKEAKGLIATLAEDKDNLFLVLTAKLKNPEIKIVSKAVELSMIKKLKTAGATYVVSPNFIGGMRIASEILRPHVVTFLDEMLKDKDSSMRIWESTFKSHNKNINKTLKESGFIDKFNIPPIAFKKSKNQNFIYNPHPETKIEADDTIVYIANGENHNLINEFVS